MYIRYSIDGRITPGLDVKEVAHDHQVQVSRLVTEEFGFLNSYDTWHGALEVHSFLCTNVYYTM